MYFAARLKENFLMKSYYFYSGSERKGPYSLNEIRSESITADTLIWYHGLEDWKRAKELEEFKDLFEDNFSFGAILAALLFGYIAYDFFLPVTKGLHKVHGYLNSDDFIAKILMKFLDYSTDKGFSSFLKFIHLWFWAILISHVIKVFFSVKQAFNPSSENISIIGWTALILEVSPVFFKVWSNSNFEDALQIMLIVYIPTIIGIAFMYSKEAFD